MAVRADVISNRRHVQRALQAVGFVALLGLAVGTVLTAGGAFAGGLTASSVKPAYDAYAPILTDTTDTPTSTTDTPTSTPNPCDPAWSVVSSPNPGTSWSDLNDVEVVTANDVWAVGHYLNSCGGCAGTLIEHWDGTSWSLVPSPNASAGNNLFGVAAVSANDVWAVGGYNGTHTLIEHWDGTSWSLVPSPDPSTGQPYLRGVAAVSATDVWAVGFYEAGSLNQTLILHWNGTSWSVVPSPNVGTSNNQLYGVAAVSANDVWAVGGYASSGRSQTLIEHWNGTSWSVVSSPNVGTNENHLLGVAAVSANDVWAVGWYAGGGYPALIEHWNGTSWSVVSSPNDGIYNYMYGVAAVSANDVWAVGYSDALADPTLIEHWNGTSWSVVLSPSPNLGYNLSGIAAASPNDVWAVGQYANGSGVYSTLVEHYATLCGTPTSTPTNTATVTNTPTPGSNIINGHLTWQGVAAANRPSVTGTLQLCVSGSTQTFNFTTDTNGTFTVTNAVSDGTYHWRIKGGRHISSASPADGADLVVINGYAMQEFGTQRGGDAAGGGTSDNIVNSTDFNRILTQFGLSGIRSADFDYNNVVNILDFNILKGNFGQAGHVLTCP